MVNKFVEDIQMLRFYKPIFNHFRAWKRQLVLY